MDKIKKVFSPGASKDDEVLYGDASQRKASASATPQDTTPLHTTAEGEKKDKSVLRQLVNPGGDKYDEQRFGATATTDKEHSDLAADQPPKDHSVLRQILNPGGDKYEETRFGSTSGPSGAGHASTGASQAAAASSTEAPMLQTDPAEKKHEHGVLRQILNPGGNKYDNEGYGVTAHAVDDSSSSTRTPQHDTTSAAPTHTGASSGYSGAATAIPGTTFPLLNKEGGSPTSALSIKSGVEGPFAHTDEEATGTHQHTAAEQTLPDRTHQSTTGGDSHAGRDTAIAGSAVAGGAAAYEGHKHHEASRTDPTSTSSTFNSQTHPQSTTNQTGLGQNTGAVGALGSENTRTSGIGSVASETPGTGSSNHLGRDAAIGSTGLAGGAAAYELNKSHEHSSGSALADDSSSRIIDRPHPLNGGATGDTTGVPTSSTFGGPGHANERGVHQPYEGVVHHTHGPHPTDIANQIDPHVPGEFPTTTGQDRHAYSGQGLATGAVAGAGTGALASGSSQPTKSSSVGAFQSGVHDRAVPTTENTLTPGTTLSSGSTQTGTTHGTLGGNAEHHYGRDAAVVGGVGAAGVGAHELSKDRNDTGPASKTVGPHDSNIANIVDPRVKPDPAQLTGQSSTTKHAETDTHHSHGAEYAAESHHDKHHNKLQKPRKDETETHGDHTEKKPSLLHRILHPGEKSASAVDEPTQKQLHQDEAHSQYTTPHQQLQSTSASGPLESTGATGEQGSGRVIEPHTGLPMNVDKYGVGTGGTDGAKNIEGYHETNPALQRASIGTAEGAGTKQGHHPGEEGVAGPDWEAIRKSNTPY